MNALKHPIFRAALLAVLVLSAAPAMAQSILLDQPVRAGELILFPDLNNASVFYYVSDKPKLAVDANGTPQFSFLRYVENVRTGADQPEAREGEGGGIVHALVSLSVSQDQLREAQRALQRVRPGARIQGPVVYKSGRFGLVSSFKDTQGNLTKQVVGLGAAPILDGEKAAVSMQLTKLGAKILWESFKTPNPDISFTFEMEMGGFRSPHRALIEADFDQIYEHQAFAAGIASGFLAAEIRGAFDDLRREGAIKLTQVGEDEKLDALITTAYNKISDMMFSPMGGTGTPSLDSLAGTANGTPSLLDRATTMLARNREETERRNEVIRRENREADERERAGTTTPTGGTNGGQGGGAPAGGTPGTGPASGDASGPVVTPSAAEAGINPPAQNDPREAGRLSHQQANEREAARTPRRQEESAPSLAIVATFEMKRIRQQGKFRIDLNKYTSDNLTLRFDENIGDLRSLQGDANHFREVNLDDPLFRQRELVVFLDGLNAQDFGQFVNFVTVHMKKRHAGGDLTDDEVRIDRNNFNQAGNNFKLLYGWKGDNDRRRWAEYEYQTQWSFFGGRTVQEAWRPATAGAINVAPPYQRRVVDLQADPSAVAAAGVRSITIKIFYDLGGAERVKQVTLNAANGQLSDKVEFMLPADTVDYAYEITWRLTGNQTRSSGRQTTSETLLFVDEVPTT
jgi:hypothetical protein